jgi:outer membrane protein assembly factor BamE (lipoprotein component of BamABCDE complex)
MQRLFVGLCVILVLAGCSQKIQQVPDGGGADPRSLTHIDETDKIKIGMHENEVVRILGPPASKESGFYSGYRLWYKLYNPKYDTIPTNFLISIDRYGYVTFISAGG